MEPGIRHSPPVLSFITPRTAKDVELPRSIIITIFYYTGIYHLYSHLMIFSCSVYRKSATEFEDLVGKLPAGSHLNNIWATALSYAEHYVD